MQARTLGRNTAGNSNAIIELLVVFCLLCRLGFPGNLAQPFGGDRIHFLIDYASSFLQLILIMLCSANTVLDIKLLDLKKKYLPIYVMLLIMYGISWMVTENPAKQTSIIIRFTITALFGIWLADNYEPERILELLYMAYIGIVIANLLTMFVFRSAGYHIDENYGYTFRGIFSQKNGLGATFAYGLMFQVTLLRMKMKKGQRMSKFFWLTMGFQLFFLLNANATTAIFCCVVPIAYQIIHDRLGRDTRIQWGVVYTVVSVGFLFISMTILPLFAPLLEALGKDATLTGRIPMWEGIIDFLTENHTMTGYGMLQFWETPSALKALQKYYARASWYRTMANGAHCNLLEIWLDLGLVGLGAYFFTTVFCFRNVKQLTKDEYTLASAIILPIMISGLTDRFYTNSNARTMLFFTLLALACNGVDRRKKRAVKNRRAYIQRPSPEEPPPGGDAAAGAIHQGGAQP